MNRYIRERIRTDATHLVARAALESGIAHKGVRGRFRELLVDSMLAPWLPPYAECATGVVMDFEDRARRSTQDDIVIIDRSLIPPVFAHASAREGVFPYDGVLARVEVKSRLTRLELKSAVAAARDIVDMKLCSSIHQTLPAIFSPRPLNTVFAFSSDLTGSPDDELKRLLAVSAEFPACDDIPGPIVALCVTGRGCWMYGGKGHNPSANWMRTKILAPHDEVIQFLGVLSNSCFSIHSRRSGIDPRNAVGGGIGNYILSDDTWELVSPPQTQTQ